MQASAFLVQKNLVIPRILILFYAVPANCAFAMADTCNIDGHKTRMPVTAGEASQACLFFKIRPLYVKSLTAFYFLLIRSAC